MWHRTEFARWIALCALCVGVLYSPDSRAATDEERAAARALAEQGARAYQGKKYDDAVDLFTRAEALIHSPVHLLFLARARRELGHLVKAREAYIKITREQVPAGAPKVFFDAQRDATAELEEIEPRLASLTVTITGVAPEAARVTLDGEPVPSVLLGVPMPVDPGSHELVVSADGAPHERASVSLAEGQRDELTLALALTDAPTSPPEPKSDPIARGEGGPAKGGSESNALTVIGWTSVGLGAVGGGVAGYYWNDGASLQDEADRDAAACGACPPDEEQRIRQRDEQAAEQKTTAAIVGSMSGAVLITGIVLLIVDQSDGPSAGAWTPWVGLNALGVTGRF